MLIAALALNLDFVTRDGLQQAMQTWSPASRQPLSRTLVERGLLPVRRANLLEQVAEEFIAEHENNASLALASLCSVRALGLDIDEITGAALRTNVSTLMGTPSTLGGQTSQALPPGFGATPAPVRGRRFKPIRLHARGALGQVYVALDEELNREVALKEMQQPYAGNEEGRARFLAEAEITGQLEHPGIVPVYALGKHPDGRPYYAMRFIRGESLHDAITRFHSTRGSDKEGPSERALALRGLLTRFVAVCNAVAYAHSRGVVHRDIKPANVMLGPYGETLVVDWGLAKAAGKPVMEGSGEMPVAPVEARAGIATTLGLAVGTPAYMPPEQASGKLDQVGPASDIYSLGATLYHLLTGELPFDGETTSDILQAVRAGRMVPPRKANREVPEPLEAVVLKAMSMDPFRRYKTANELAQEVERWLADERVLAYREPLWMQAGRWMRHNRSVVAGLAALVFTAIVGLTVGLYAVGREQALTAKQRDVAEANLKLAQKAVNKCFVRVTREPLLQGEKMRRVRELLLREALPFYEGFRSQNPDDEGLKEEEGMNLYRVARITAELGKKEEALEAYRKARNIFSGLADDTGRAVYRANVARIWHDLGKLHHDKGDRDEARKAYGHALALYEALPDSGAVDVRLDLADTHNNLGALDESEGNVDGARAHLRQVRALAGENDDVRHTLGAMAQNLGVMLARRNRKDEALVHFKEARDARRKLVRPGAHGSRPLVELAQTLTDMASVQETRDALASLEEARDMIEAALVGEQPGHLDALARVEDRLGTLWRGEDRATEAERAYTRALDLRGRLAKQYPREMVYKTDLVGTRINMAHLLRETKREKEAVEWFGRAFAEMPPGDGDDVRGLRLLALEGRAEAYGTLGEHRKAATDWDAARALARGEERSRLHAEGALSRARAGNHAAALADAATLEKGKLNADRKYQLACIWSLASGRVTGDEKERRAKRAVAFLIAAREAGFFKTAGTADHARKDEDLFPLKGRKDFEDVINSLAKP
jgi:serine/threonine-protein kinase